MNEKHLEYSAGAVLYTIVDGEIKYVFIESLEGFFGFPKGHLEKGETSIDAEYREIFEETGIKATIDETFTYTDVHPIPQKKHTLKSITYFVAFLITKHLLNKMKK